MWRSGRAASRRIQPQTLAQYGLDTTVREATVRIAPSPQALVEQADIVSVHLALGPDTRGFVNAELLGRMKKGATFINTARAEVVDYDALSAAVRDRGIRVGLDVFRNEPTSATGEYRDDLLQLPGVYGTHHIGASTDQAQEAIAAETVRIVASFRETGRVPNVVNLAVRTPATHRLIVRHRDRPGVLAHVFDHLRQGDINVQETENIVFDGAQAAIARINVDRAPGDALLAAIRDGNADIISLQLVAI